MLGALATIASAGRFSLSATRLRSTWARWDFAGGFGTVECELVLETTFHARTFAKVVNTLIGYVTEGRVNRCARGGRTILRETLPWHVTYRSFNGTLPNITAISTTIPGFSFIIREPTFGITCLARGTAIGTYALSSGTLTTASLSGSIPCGEFTGGISGSTTNVDNSAGARVTITLI